jgi:GR25 family glycosyltransferase involved in LPS biosynthesis
MKIKFYILGIERNFRGAGLYEDILSNGFDVQIIWGFDAKEITFPNFRDDEKSIFFYRRILTDEEIACTLGHRLILLQAQRDGVDFAIILEDDAQITNMQELVASVIHIPILNPLVLMLIVDQRLTISSRRQVDFQSDFHYRRIISNPSPSSAYALNSTAIEVLANTDENELRGFQADFPLSWFRKVKYYEIFDSTRFISLAPNESLIPGRKRVIKDPNKLIVRFFKLMLPWRIAKAKSYDVFPVEYFAHFILRPVAWRISKKISHAESKK